MIINPKYFVFWLLAFFLIAGKNMFAQYIPPEKCIKLWKDKDLYPQQMIINDLFFNFDSNKAKENLDYFQKYIDKRDNERIKANVLIYKTYFLIRDSKFEENFTSLSKEIVLQMKNTYPLKDKSLTAWLYFLYAEINMMRDKVEEALLFNLKAIEAFEGLPDAAFPEKSNLYHAITRALFSGNEYEKSIEFGKKCESALEKEDKMKSDTRIYNCDFLFISLMNLERLDEAEEYLAKLKDAIDTYSFESEWRNEVWQGVYYNYLGQLLLRKGNYDDAYGVFQKALPFVQKHNDRSNIISIKMNLGMIENHFDRLNNAGNEWREALAISEKFILENPQNRSQTVKLLKYLVDLNNKQENYRIAYLYSEKYNEQKAILDKQLERGSIRVAQAKIKNEFLENELNQYVIDLHLEKRIRTIIVLTSLLILLSLLYVIYTVKKRNQLVLEVKEKERMIIEEDLANAEKNIHDFKKLVTSKNTIISELSAVLPTELSAQTKRKVKNYIILTDEDWEEFRVDFSKTYPMFFGNLKNYAPEITPALLRLAALLYLELTVDEIASSLGISEDSVSRSKRRLRSVLNLTPDEDLSTWLQMFYSSIH